MKGHVANCPYCGRCEIGIDDRPQLVFQPAEDSQTPCPHLIKVAGRFSEYQLAEHGLHHLVGSLELSWESRCIEDDSSRLDAYFNELITQGGAWPFAPSCPFTVVDLTCPDTPEGTRGDLFSEVDGWAIFAKTPTEFCTEAKAKCEEHLASLAIPED